MEVRVSCEPGVDIIGLNEGEVRIPAGGAARARANDLAAGWASVFEQFAAVRTVRAGSLQTRPEQQPIAHAIGLVRGTLRVGTETSRDRSQRGQRTIAFEVSQRQTQFGGQFGKRLRIDRIGTPLLKHTQSRLRAANASSQRRLRQPLLASTGFNRPIQFSRIVAHTPYSTTSDQPTQAQSYQPPINTRYPPVNQSFIPPLSTLINLLSTLSTPFNNPPTYLPKACLCWGGCGWVFASGGQKATGPLHSHGSGFDSLLRRSPNPLPLEFRARLPTKPRAQHAPFLNIGMDREGGGCVGRRSGATLKGSRPALEVTQERKSRAAAWECRGTMSLCPPEANTNPHPHPPQL